MVPEIFNTDQGVQFTSRLFKEIRKRGSVNKYGGKERALDNVFVARLWRSVKYEDVYPKGYKSLEEVEIGLRSYFEFYNKNRPHQGLVYRTPA